MTSRSRSKTKPSNNSKEKPSPADAFYDAYQELCKEHGLMINVIPVFRSRDDGTWSVVLQSGIAELPKG